MTAPLPEGAYALALAELPGAGPARLSEVLTRRSPSEAWSALRDGRLPAPDGPGSPPLPLGAPRTSWQELARRRDPERSWRRAGRSGVRVTWVGDQWYPNVFRSDPGPPGVLFWRGRLEVLDRVCVAMVGTRRATPEGRRVAAEMARDLAAAGMCVVSGLALGIDGAAHRGALAAGGPTAGVAASGADVAYPRRHAGLWEEVVGAGAVISETPPGRPAQAWRFPSRNRLIAGAAGLVVVVESGERGGSLHTVDAALRRGVDVGAVPGPVRSPASAGTNRLLRDGAIPICSADDVFDALSLRQPAPAGDPVQPAPAAGTGHAAGVSDPDIAGGRVGGPEAGDGASARRRSAPEGAAGAVLEALGWTPVGVGLLAERTGLPIATLSGALDQLEAGGWAERQGSWWSRR